jgi:hypothetical protein
LNSINKLQQDAQRTIPTEEKGQPPTPTTAGAKGIDSHQATVDYLADIEEIVGKVTADFLTRNHDHLSKASINRELASWEERACFGYSGQAIQRDIIISYKYPVYIQARILDNNVGYLQQTRGIWEARCGYRSAGKVYYP